MAPKASPAPATSGRASAVSRFLLDHSTSALKAAAASVVLVPALLSVVMQRAQVKERAAVEAALIISIFWAGGVFAINFLEAWVKFQAPSITRALGLDVGRHVFSLLNKFEILLCAAVLFLHATLASSAAGAAAARAAEGATAAAASGVAAPGPWLLVVVALVAVETALLLPVLLRRAAKVVAGEPIAPSHVHLVAVASAALKVSLLLTAAHQLLRMYVQPFSATS